MERTFEIKLSYEVTWHSHLHTQTHHKLKNKQHDQEIENDGDKKKKTHNVLKWKITTKL